MQKGISSINQNLIILRFNQDAKSSLLATNKPGERLSEVNSFEIG